MRLRTLRYWCAPFLLFVASTADTISHHSVAKGLSARSRTCLDGLRVRGGFGSFYEANPDYEPSPAFAQRPMLVGDLEQEQPRYGSNNNMYDSTTVGSPLSMNQNTYFSTQPTNGMTTSSPSQSVVNSLKLYFWSLHAASPAVAQTLVASLAIFLLWQVPLFQPILQKYFVCSRRNVRAGRLPAVLTSAVSHTGLFHLAANMMGLVSLGPAVTQTLQQHGRWPVWPLLVGGALAGSTAYLVLDKFGGGCVGLSGVTLALLAVHAQQHPKSIMGFLLMGIIPVRLPAVQALRVCLAWSVWCTYAARRGRRGGGGGGAPIAHSAHLGGLLFGLAYHAAWVRRREVGKLLHGAQRTWRQKVKPMVPKLLR